MSDCHHCAERLARLESETLAQNEYRQLGHRVIFDTKTGWSRNISGVHCDPSKLDNDGYRMRL